MRRHRGIEDGFTLIELLVVIGVLGILASLLLPALSLAKSYAKSAACKNHLHEMGLALQMYVNDNQNRYPYYLGSAGPSYGDATSLGRIGLVYWSSKLFPYYPMNWTNSSFHCPGYSGKISGPYDRRYANRFGSYGYNGGGAGLNNTEEYFGLGPIIFWSNAQGNLVPPVSQAEVRVPSDMLAIGDSLMKVEMMAGGSDFWRCRNPEATVLADAPYALPHGKNYNVLLCDGHVVSIKPSVLFDPTNTASMWNYDNQPHPELWSD